MPRYPTMIVSVTLALFALLSFLIGVVLDVIVKNDINHWQECFISDLKQIVPRSAESQQRDKVATFPKLA